MIVENAYHTAERQNTLLVMMKELHPFLEENGIVYSLSSGSLLGAVRHNGFVPWDDDIDIMVDRENYTRLLEILSDCDGYVLQKSLWIYRLRRKEDEALGDRAPTIDLFVIDAAPDNKLLQKYKVFRLMMLQGMMKKEADYSKFSFFYRFCLRATHLLGKLFSYERKFRKYDRVSQIGGKKRTKKVACYNGLFRCLPLRYDCDIMAQTSLHRFEDTEFRIIDRYDHYLTVMYGDYMTPPPESERIPIHL